MGLLINPVTKLLYHSDDEALIQKRQFIPTEVVDRNRAAFESSKTRSANELERYASIPTTIYYKWLDEGWDCDEHTPEQIVAKLRREGLDYFVTSSKFG